MLKERIFILHGDPNPESLSGELANQYEKAAKEAGYEIRRTNLGQIQFDPILHKGYRAIQELEPDLKKIQEDMQWSNHIVILYSVWWASMPSLMKGMFDRMWLPGFAFHFRKKHMGWLRELSGRSCRIIMTSGSYPWLVRYHYGDPSYILRKAILWFAGISPIKVTWFGPVNSAPPEKVNKWRSKAYELGLNGE